MSPASPPKTPATAGCQSAKLKSPSLALLGFGKTAAIAPNTNKAMTPPGNGNLFGITMNAAGDGFYYVSDDVNTVVLAK